MSDVRGSPAGDATSHTTSHASSADVDTMDRAALAAEVRRLRAEVEKIRAFLAAEDSLRCWESFVAFGPDGPPVGSRVFTVRGGFGSHFGGVKLYVVGRLAEGTDPGPHVASAFRTRTPAYIQLSPRKDGPVHYLSEQRSWWRDFYVRQGRGEGA